MNLLTGVAKKIIRLPLKKLRVRHDKKKEIKMQKFYSEIIQIAGDVITVEADDVSYKELAEVRTKAGISLAQVIRLEGKKVFLQVLAGSRGVSTNDKVRFLRSPMQVPFSADLLGRIFNGSGKPRDNGPELKENMIPVGGPSVNPAKFRKILLTRSGKCGSECLPLR